jgi:hypothetical protein
MTRHAFIQDVAADRTRVFELFCDLRQAPEHVRGIERLEVLTDGPIRAGTRFRETRRFGRREATEEMEVTALRAPEHYTVASQSMGCAFRSTFRFHEAGSGTRVEVEFHCEPRTWLARVLSPLMGLLSGTVKRCIEEDLRDLAAAAEGGVSAARR